MPGAVTLGGAGGFAAALALASTVLSPSSVLAQVDGGTGPAATSPVLLELFTSQGCSSCPPADRLLTELAARHDIDVIPLSFHVDYWNYIGWTDPFSSAAWSDRQRRYSRVFDPGRIYTPQMVVNGRWQGVGANRAEILRRLRSESSSPRRAELAVRAATVSEELVRVSVEVLRLEPSLARGTTSAWAAVVESNLETAVGRGENGGRTLRNDRVVRRLEVVPGLEAIGAGRRSTFDVGLDETWRRDQLSVVVFLQNDATLSVETAAEVQIAR